MSFQTHEWSPRLEKADLEEARVSATPEDGEPLHVHYLDVFDGGACSPWKLIGFCTLVGIVNFFFMFFTLEATTDLRSSDIILETDIILLSTAILISLVWRYNSPRYQSAKESYHPDDEALSRFRLRTAGSLFAIMLSPTVACFALLVISRLLGPESLSYFKPGIPLFMSWATVNALAVCLIPSSVKRQDIAEQGELSWEKTTSSSQRVGGYWNHNYFDETDGPTFLPQQPIFTHYDDFRGVDTPEMKAFSTLAVGVPYGETAESPEAIRKAIRWAITAPEGFLRPHATELLVMAAASIEVYLDGADYWDEDTQYAYLVSRMCDRLAEIFHQANPAGVPIHVVDVFLFVGRFEQLGEIGFTPSSQDSCYIPAEQIDRIVRCLKAKSAALLGC